MNQQKEIASVALGLGTATLYEASGLDCMADPKIRPVWQGAAIAAQAFPVQCSPGDNLALHLALEQAPEGSVLVAGTDNFIAGYWGEVMTVAAQKAGLKGLVIDGGVRDVAGLEKRNFPVFSSGISVRGTAKANAPSVGDPITFTGIPVATGDLVVGDEDGLIVIPADHVEKTIAAGQAREEKEAKIMTRLAQGETTVELFGLEKWRKNNGE